MKRIILSVFAAAVTAAWAIPASAGDVTFSGQYRLRGEYVDNQDRVNATDDKGDFWAQRVRLTANAKATDDVSAKITLQDTRVWGQGGDGATSGTLSDFSTNNSLDFHEAYLNVSNIFGTPVSLRAGRQELAYGDERLIGSFGWSNHGRAFDGAKLMYTSDAVNVDVFSMVVDELSTATAAGFPAGAATGMQDTTLNGIYATLKQLIPNNTLDAYLFHQNYKGTESTRYTAGARLKGAAAGVDYTAEGAYQFGETASVDVAAYAFAVKAGYTLPTPMKIRVGAEYDYATGADADAAENEAFDNLYPTNHAHFGIGDVAVANTWSDIQAWSVNASVDLNEKTRLYAAYWSYTEQETEVADTSDEIGSEIDLVATYKYNNNVSIEAGAARFMPGDQAGVNDDARDWAYLQITANF